ncbi:MAG: hypothetical protein VX516_00550 [Actinomycetota bacterium]|nr:hypothetical protein [Actinomycetota bacterium]
MAWAIGDREPGLSILCCDADMIPEALRDLMFDGMHVSDPGVRHGLGLETHRR